MDSTGPFVGRLFDRVGPRSVYTLGLGLLGAGLSLATLGTALWHFQLCIGLAAGVTAACLDNVPNGTLLVPLALLPCAAPPAAPRSQQLSPAPPHWMYIAASRATVAWRSSEDLAMATILLIEDDEPLAYALSLCLDSAGHRVITAVDANAALEKLATNEQIDLLLTDIIMPQGQPHGLSLARMARWKRRDLAVILMTGHPELVKHASGERVLLKPVMADVILAEVAAALTPIRAIS
jgi:CheY-like chemotaxis protein